MCLAIPGQVIELFPDQPNIAVIDVVGVRRKVDLGLLQDNLPLKGGLGAHPCRLRHEQDQRTRRS